MGDASNLYMCFQIVGSLAGGGYQLSLSSGLEPRRQAITRAPPSRAKETELLAAPSERDPSARRSSSLRTSCITCFISSCAKLAATHRRFLRTFLQARHVSYLLIFVNRFSLSASEKMSLSRNCLVCSAFAAFAGSAAADLSRGACHSIERDLGYRESSGQWAD